MGSEGGKSTVVRGSRDRRVHEDRLSAGKLEDAEASQPEKMRMQNQRE